MPPLPFLLIAVVPPVESSAHGRGSERGSREPVRGLRQGGRAGPAGRPAVAAGGGGWPESPGGVRLLRAPLRKGIVYLYLVLRSCQALEGVLIPPQKRLWLPGEG